MRYVRKELPGVTLNLSTNAGLLTRRRSALIIDEGLLDKINFDIDGITKETYERIRLKVNFDKVMDNVLYFTDYRKRVKKSTPETSVTIIRMQPTLDEIDAFVGFWTPLVDNVLVNDYNTWLGTKENLNTSDTLKKSRNWKFDFACQHPWNELVISADGRAGLCCLDYDMKAEVGDLREQSIAEIWRGEKMDHYRHKLMKLEYGDIEVCRNCNAFLYQYESKWARLQR